MIKSTMLYIIFCLIIAFTIMWVFIFKKFIYDKFIFLILNATNSFITWFVVFCVIFCVSFVYTELYYAKFG